MLPRSAKADMNVYIRTTCRFTCHPCVKRYEHKRKACLPHTPKRIISAFTCTVNIHVEDVKAHPQRSGSAPEGCCIFIPSLPTLLQAIHSPEGSKESISLFSFFLSAPENGKRGHNARFENTDHVISHWRGAYFSTGV